MQLLTKMLFFCVCFLSVSFTLSSGPPTFFLPQSPRTISQHFIAWFLQEFNRTRLLREKENEEFRAAKKEMKNEMEKMR